MTPAELNRIRTTWQQLRDLRRELLAVAPIDGSGMEPEWAQRLLELADGLTPVLNGDLAQPEPAAQASLFDAIPVPAVHLVFRSE